MMAAHTEKNMYKEELPLPFSSPKGFFGSRSWFKGHVTPRHTRSKSAPDSEYESENWDFSPGRIEIGEVKGFLKSLNTENDVCYGHRASLEQDVTELQKQLKSERVVRHVLEKAMGRASSTISPGHRHLSSQAEELISEISCLEEEVADLEQHVLSLYRRVFRRCLFRSTSIYHLKQKEETCTAKEDKVQKQRKQRQHYLEQCKLSKVSPMATTKQKQCVPTQLHRHDTKGWSSSNDASCLVQMRKKQTSVLCEKVETGARSAHSRDLRQQTLLRLKELKKIPTKRYLDVENYDVTRPLREYLSKTPNRLSEELVLCMTAIYCKLSDPPLPHIGVSESPSSSASFSSVSSFHGFFSDGWSPGWKVDLPYNIPLIDPYQVKGRAGSTGAYSFMVEVPCICVDKDRLSYAARMLRNFRSMVEQLEKVDPCQMKHDEKLAFWINVYNALMMHTYLAYGIPRNNLKRVNLLQKAAYKVGAHSINAYTIEHSILCCRSHRPTQWLHTLLSPGSRFKAGDERRAYAIDKPEPLVCFALCCGGRSDPAIRLYTAKCVHEELDVAKRDFLQASIGYQSNKKVMLPKILDWYAREASINFSDILDWVCQNVDEKENDLIQRCIKTKPHKNASHFVEWGSYNFNFRYIFDRDLATRFTSSTHS